MIMLTEELNNILSQLNYEKYYIIKKIYFYSESRRILAKEMGIFHTLVLKKELKILNKTKKFFKFWFPKAFFIL